MIHVYQYRGCSDLLRFGVLKRGDCGEQVFDIFTHDCVPEESVVGPLSDGHCYEKQSLMKYPYRPVVIIDWSSIFGRQDDSRR